MNTLNKAVNIHLYLLTLAFLLWNSCSKLDRFNLILFTVICKPNRNKPINWQYIKHLLEYQRILLRAMNKDINDLGVMASISRERMKS